MKQASSLDWRVWKLTRRGWRKVDVASRVGLPESKISACLARVEDERKSAREEADDASRVPSLLPSFGGSCKPLALLECKDVHPCRACGGRGLGCKACQGTGARSLKNDKTPFFCAVCDVSGWDHSSESIATPIAPNR